jgi:hypothetical protein
MERMVATEPWQVMQPRTATQMTSVHYTLQERVAPCADRRWCARVNERKGVCSKSMTKRVPKNEIPVRSGKLRRGTHDL